MQATKAEINDSTTNLFLLVCPPTAADVGCDDDAVRLAFPLLLEICGGMETPDMVLVSVVTPICVEFSDCNIVAEGLDVDTDNSALVREFENVAKVTITAVLLLLVLDADKTSRKPNSRSTGVVSWTAVRCPYPGCTMLQQFRSPSLCSLPSKILLRIRRMTPRKRRFHISSRHSCNC